MKQDIALPYKKEKKPKKKNNNFKKFFKDVFGNPPKSKLVLITTYTGFALAIVAFILALIPPVNSLGLWVAVFAVALELFGFIKKDGEMSKKMVLVSAVALVVAVSSVAIENIYNQSLIDRQMYLQSGDATEELLDKDVTVVIGDWNEQGLEVKIRNNNSENKGYGVQIEAKSKDASVVVDEMISVSGILSGKEFEITIFKRLSDGQKEALNDAEYKILSVSQF